MKITLRTRLVLLVMVGVVPLLGLALVEAWMNANEDISRSTDNLKAAASLVAAQQERVVDSTYNLLVSIANAPGLAEGKTAGCQRYFKTLNDQLPEYANLGIIGLDGHFRCDGVGNSPDVFVGDRDYFQAALARRGFVAGGYLVSRAREKPLTLFAMPMMDSEAKATAVAFAAMDLNVLSKAVANAPLPPGGRLVITDRQGIVLAANPETSAMIGQQVPNPLLQDAVKAMRSGVGEGPDAEGLQRIFAFMPAGKSADFPFFVAVSLDRDGVFDPTRKEIRLQFMLITLLASLGGWIAWMMGGRAIVKPTTELLEATRQVEQGRLDVRIPISAGDDAGEFSRIAAGFNRMAESLQRHSGELGDELARSQAVQEKMQDAQRLGRIGYWQSDLDTQQVWWSDEVYEVLGVDRALLGNTFDGFLQRVHPDDREAYGAERVATTQAGSPRSIEYRVVTSAGEVRWIHQFGRAQVNAEGEQGRRRAGVMQDITERKQAEQELRDSEQRYAALFEVAPVPMYVFDSATHQFLAVNQVAIQSYGYSAEEFFSMTLFDFYPESEHDHLRQTLGKEVPRRTGRWQHRRKDASVFPVEAVSQSIHYAGRAARFVVAVDIAVQLQAEKDVTEHLLMLQRAADAAQAVTWHQTLQGTLQEVAEQARGVIGAHQAAVSLTLGNDWAQTVNALSLSEKYANYRELIEPMDGSGIHALVSESNRALRLTQAELEAHPRWRGFGRYAGKHPPMRGWLAVPLTARDGKNIGLLQLSDKYEGEFTQQDEYVAMELAQLASGAIENARLIEEVSRLNTGLEQKVAERTTALRVANHELEAFSYSVSHDLRSPLNTIDGFSQLLARQLAESGNEKARHYLSRIRAGTVQMGQLITDLLSLAQVSRTQLRSESVDLSALASDVLGGCQARQPERQMALHIEPGLQAQGDAGLLRVVLENLLGNACKFSSQQAQAEISVGQKPDAAGEPVFFVKDNGAGFDMAYADKLFQPFQRLHALVEFPGTGVGLATVSRVIARHGGRIWADAAPGRGATFFFTLPKVPVAGLGVSLLKA